MCRFFSFLFFLFFLNFHKKIKMKNHKKIFFWKISNNRNFWKWNCMKNISFFIFENFDYLIFFKKYFFCDFSFSFFNENSKKSGKIKKLKKRHIIGKNRGNSTIKKKHSYIVQFGRAWALQFYIIPVINAGNRIGTDLPVRSTVICFNLYNYFSTVPGQSVEF